MNSNNSLDNIIKTIQGNDEQMYTEEEAKGLNDLLEKARNFLSYE